MASKKLTPLDDLRSKATGVVRAAGQFVQNHPRALAAVVSLSLMGFGVTAFGLAPLAPDAAKLPRRMVTEVLEPVGAGAQLEALAQQNLQLYRSDVTKSADTVDTLLKRLGVNDVLATAFLRHDGVARHVVDGHADKMVQVRTDAAGNLEELIARYPTGHPDQAATHFSRLRMSRYGGSFITLLEVVPLQVQTRMASGVIQASLSAAMDQARIPDSVSSQMAEVFSKDVDFRQKLRKGDTFNVLFESLTADGEPVAWNEGVGRLLAAEFTSHGRSHGAMWFKDSTDPTKKGAYFEFDGKSKNRAFLASPLEFSHVTSGFSMRLHPIHHTWKAHRGVDYAAPIGTPVHSVGEGVVEFSGWQNGYGQVVQIKHHDDRTTLYGHLSRIDVTQGARVEKGATIGAVGSTGWSTGPHLHFEFRVKGEHQDPLLIAKESESATLSPLAMAQFASQAKDWRRQLQLAASVRLGSPTYTE